MKHVRELVERRDGNHRDLSPLAATFLRGLGLGALVGAAIAGSAILRRVRAPREEADHPAPTPEPAQREDPV